MPGKYALFLWEEEEYLLLGGGKVIIFFNFVIDFPFA